MQNILGGGKFYIPPIVKNLLIINALFFLGSLALEEFDIDVGKFLSLYYFESSFFRPYQYITHMFMHGNFQHILFNMFGLWMFGSAVEQTLGSKKFIIYFFITGIGAALLHTLILHYRISSVQEAFLAFQNTPSPEYFKIFMQDNFSQYFEIISRDDYFKSLFSEYAKYPDNPQLAQGAINFIDSIIGQIMDIPTVGASGAIFGIVLAFGMLFPNAKMFFIFVPFPIKAKYFVIIYGIIELYEGVMNQPGDNVAHFAHLGGMLFGFLLLKYWKTKN
mgnify:CR=1 FL=1|jgi:membrane associated rhomboid family serine protease